MARVAAWVLLGLVGYSIYTGIHAWRSPWGSTLAPVATFNPVLNALPAMPADCGKTECLK